MLAISLAMFVVGTLESVVNNRQMHFSMRLTMHLKVRLRSWTPDGRLSKVLEQ